MALMLGSASPAPATTEDELIDAARVGDDRAFAELYARYRHRIELYIRARVRDPGRAEDVAQEVFISALRRLRSSDQVIVLKPWIYEIAKNACIDEHRRSQRNREISLDAEEGLSDGRGALLSIAPTPPAAMERKQQLDDLRGAFGGLSKNHHQLLVMREFEGLSYDEIGRRTGMSRQMVESALFRARRKLGVEYQELASGRRCVQVQTAIDGGKLSSSRALGVRERRQVARHLSHCQACRVKAQLAGVGERLARPGLAAKIAALLPFPALRLRLFGRAAGVAVRTGAHPGLQAAAVNSDSGPSALLGCAAAAAVALAIAGAGGSPGARGGTSSPRQTARTNAAATSNRRDFAPGVGTVAPVSGSGYAGRWRGRGTADRRGDSRAVTLRPAAGAPTAAPRTRQPSVGAGLPLAGSATSAAVSTVTQTVSAASRVAQSTVQSVAQNVEQGPVGRTLSTALSTAAPIISAASGSLPGSVSAPSAPSAPLGTGNTVAAP